MLVSIRKLFSSIIAFCILCMPILRYYDIFGSIGFESFLRVVVFITLILYSFIERTHLYDPVLIKTKRNSILFLTWCVLVCVFYTIFTPYNYSNINAGYSLMSYIMALLSGVIIVMIINCDLDYNFVIKLYEKMSIFIILICFIQWILYMSGIVISFRLPFSFSEGWSGLGNIPFGMGYNRNTSLFSEPAHFSEYIIPFVAICLFSDKLIEKKRFIKAAMGSFAIILTASGNGIISLLIVWGLYFLFFGKMDLKNRLIIIFLAIAGLFFLISVMKNISLFNDIFNRLFSSSNSYQQSKADYRIYRGLDYYRQLSIIYKIFGVGYLNMRAFTADFAITSIFDSRYGTNAWEWFSTIAQLLLYFGIIGFTLFIKQFVSLLKTKLYCVIGLIIVFIAIAFSSQMLFNNIHMMYFLIILSAYNCSIKNEN